MSEITLNLNIRVTIPNDAHSFVPRVADALRAHAAYLERIDGKCEGPDRTGEHVLPDGTVFRWERVA